MIMAFLNLRAVPSSGVDFRDLDAIDGDVDRGLGVGEGRAGRTSGLRSIDGPAPAHPPPSRALTKSS
jgi:hypothetical protein